MSDLVLLQEDHENLARILDRLRQDANAQAAFLVDKNGQQLGLSGELREIDPTSMASLTAGNVAATDGLAKLLGEREFSVIFHEGERHNLHINIVSGMAVLVVIFDERSSLGLVRLRVKKATQALDGVLTQIVSRTDQTRTGYAGAFSPFHEITDEDIDALFG